MDKKLNLEFLQLQENVEAEEGEVESTTPATTAAAAGMSMPKASKFQKPAGVALGQAKGKNGRDIKKLRGHIHVADCVVAVDLKIIDVFSAPLISRRRRSPSPPSPPPRTPPPISRMHVFPTSLSHIRSIACMPSFFLNDTELTGTTMRRAVKQISSDKWPPMIHQEPDLGKEVTPTPAGGKDVVHAGKVNDIVGT